MCVGKSGLSYVCVELCVGLGCVWELGYGMCVCERLGLIVCVRVCVGGLGCVWGLRYVVSIPRSS